MAMPENTDLDYVGSKIADARNDAGLTQEDLACRLDVSPVTLHRYEAGERSLPAEKIPILARELGLSPLYFFPEDCCTDFDLLMKKILMLPPTQQNAIYQAADALIRGLLIAQ